MNGKTLPAALVLGALLTLASAPAAAPYIEAPYSLGRLVLESTNIVVMQIDKVDRENNRILYRKLKDVKGVHPSDVLRHNIAKAGFSPREWQTVMALAEPGKICLFFYNGNASETAMDTYWYQCYGGGPDWGMSHSEPFLLRSFAGRPEKLLMAVEEILANKEAIVPAMVDGNKELLHTRSGKIQRLRASLKLQDYNAARDFIGWGGDTFAKIATMPGFTHLAALQRVDPDARGISTADFDGDGATDLLIYGERRTVLCKVDGTAISEISLGYSGGARGASWADCNGDGRLDLLLATPAGPKLLMNLPKGFKDESAALPVESYYNVTGAAFMDFDGDGKPDIVLANGFLGLRLYRNPAAAAGAAPKPVKMGPWYFCGSFDNGFDTVFPPEKGVDVKAKYPGKGGAQIGWQEGKFQDGVAQSFLPILPDPMKENATVYLYREIDSETASDLPASFGSDDTLTVWLNDQKLIAENVGRGVAPDQNLATLKLKAGKNKLLMKICQGGGEFGGYFAAKEPEAASGPKWEDWTAKAGLGPDGICGDDKGDNLIVADFNGDKRPDLLFSSGTGGIILRNMPNGFIEDRGILKYKVGGIIPAAGDFDGDGDLDLFVPQAGGSKLYRNDGNWKFTDVTAESGDLAKLSASATSAVWVDLYKKGKADLIVACIGGSNRYYRNLGNGKFQDLSRDLGFDRRVTNSRAVSFGDVNKDGVLDLVFNNEGQDPFILIGDPKR